MCSSRKMFAAQPPDLALIPFLIPLKLILSTFDKVKKHVKQKVLTENCKDFMVGVTGLESYAKTEFYSGILQKCLFAPFT